MTSNSFYGVGALALVITLVWQATTMESAPSVGPGPAPALEQPTQAGIANDVNAESRHALTVRVIDHNGTPVKALAWRGRRSGMLWMNAVRVYCYPCALQEEERWNSPWSTGNGAELIAHLEPNREHVIGVYSSVHAVQEQTVTMASTEFQQEIVVQLPSPSRKATLHVAGRAPGGGEVRGELRYRIATPEGRELTIWKTYDPALEGQGLDIAPGRYSVTVAECGFFPRHAPVSEAIELAPGETKRMTMELGAAGSLGVEVEVEEPPGPGKTPSEDRRQRWRLRGLVEVVLTPTSSGPAIRTTFPRQAQILLCPGRAPGLPPGSKLRATEAIPVGRYTASLTFPGYVTHTQSLEIQAGRRTWIKATLEPTQ